MQGLKSYNAMTVRGSILLSSETNESLEVKDFRALTLKKFAKHNSQYSVTRQPTEIIFELVYYVYNVAFEMASYNRFSRIAPGNFPCNISTCLMHVVS